MKPKHFFLTTLCVFIGCYAFTQNLIQEWATPRDFETPESVLYDESNDIIYVSNINGSANEKDGNGYISKLSTDGKIKKLKWVTGLDAPKGMGIFGQTLYVADISQVVEIDIQKGKILTRYEAPGAVFLNDITIRINGEVYASDSQSGVIFRLKNGEIAPWLKHENIKTPNGLLAGEGKLLIGENSVYEVDFETREVQTVVEEGGGIDGLEKDNQGKILFSHWAGRIFRVSGGKPVKIWDSSADQINTADLDFAFKPELLLVPTFSDNRIMAFKITD
jgi:hypothetical protein